MAIDQATADYEAEQEKREALEDARAVRAESELSQPVIPKVCAQCVNWRSSRLLHRADGTTWRRPGFCVVKAAVDLPQMPQTYAERCRLYEEEIPF